MTFNLVLFYCYGCDLLVRVCVCVHVISSGFPPLFNHPIPVPLLNINTHTDTHWDIVLNREQDTEIERKTTTIKKSTHTQQKSKQRHRLKHKFRIKRYDIGLRANAELKLTSKQENVATTMEQEHYNDNFECRSLKPEQIWYLVECVNGSKRQLH